MTRALPLLALLAACAVQWAVPAWLIHRGTTTLEHGTQYRFRTAPIDPVDPFRGRYVALDFAAGRIAFDGARDYVRGQRVYAPITVGEDGFAQLAPPTAEPPQSRDYLEAKVQWASAGELLLRLPFDRYYMDERLAPEAERVYWQRNRRGLETEDPRRPAYVTVRVRKGYAVLEELYVDGKPVRELLFGADL